MAEPVAKKSLMDRFLNTVEAAGNKLPDPATLFILLAVLVLVLSAVFGAMGASAVHPGTHKVIKVVNLLTVDGFRMIWSKAVSNFSGFAPLGMVLVCVIGAGVAEKSGFLRLLCRKYWAARHLPSLLLPLFLSESTVTWRGCGICRIASCGGRYFPWYGAPSAPWCILRLCQRGSWVLRQPDDRYV